MNSVAVIETLWRGMRYATRTLRKSPGFTTVAVLSLALGIGVNTAMFSVINAVLLRALPYPEPSRLVRVGQHVTRDNATIAGYVTIPEYEFWKEHSRAFSSLAGHRGVSERRVAWSGGQEWISALRVTTEFLETLGARPVLGREFNRKETSPSGPQAIMLSDSLWRRAFGADPAVLGRAVTVDDATFTIIGVMPAGFWFYQPVDALVPLRPTGGLGDEGTNTQLIARLQDGVTIEQAQAEMAAITESFRRSHRRSPEYRGLIAVSYQDALVGDVRLNLLLLFGATSLLLVIACANLATLLLTRFAVRGREVAVRLALGSSRRALLGQFLIENLLIAALGAGVGLLIGSLLLKGLMAWMPFELPASTPVRLDGAVLAFTLAVATATALAFTLVPLLTSRRLNLQNALRSAGRSVGADKVRLRTRNVLVISEVALSTAPLVAAGLLIQSLYQLHQERLGFTTHGLITFQTPLAPERREGAERLRFTQAMLERLQARPDVRGVAAINVLPLTGQGNLPTQRDGHPEQSIGGMEIRAVTPAYFELMGIPVRRGRSFTEDDRESSLPVAVVNETVARRWWPQRDAIGDRILIGRYEGHEFLNDPPREVIGIVADTKTALLQEPPRPTVFVPMAQGLSAPTLAWIVRTDASPGLAEELRRLVAAIDPAQRVQQVRTMNDVVASTTSDSRFNASLFGVFAAVALALAAVGVYGLLSFLVTQRRQEIGTRMALGARPTDVSKLFLKQGLFLTTVGLGIGLVGALWLAGWLSSLLYGIRSDDPLSFVVVSLLLLAVGMAASYLPARRATKTDPIVALRYE